MIIRCMLIIGRSNYVGEFIMGIFRAGHSELIFIVSLLAYPEPFVKVQDELCAVQSRAQDKPRFGNQ